MTEAFIGKNLKRTGNTFEEIKVGPICKKCKNWDTSHQIATQTQESNTDSRGENPQGESVARIMEE